MSRLKTPPAISDNFNGHETPEPTTVGEQTDFVTADVRAALARLAATGRVEQTPVPDSSPAMQIVAATLQAIEATLAQLNDRVAKLDERIVEQASRKDWYSIGEAAEQLGKAEYTVREWARLNRINAHKRPSGRGGKPEWMISQDEVDRIRNKGLLPPNL
jgi:hypothetical protein